MQQWHKAAGKIRLVLGNKNYQFLGALSDNSNVFYAFNSAFYGYNQYYYSSSKSNGFFSEAG